MILLAVSTAITMIYYSGQSGMISRSAIIATRFSWITGCGDQFGAFATTEAYHTLVTYSPLITIGICLALGIVVRQYTPRHIAANGVASSRLAPEVKID